MMTLSYSVAVESKRGEIIVNAIPINKLRCSATFYLFIIIFLFQMKREAVITGLIAFFMAMNAFAGSYMDIRLKSPIFSKMC